jgi:hypothetical protein
MGLTHIKVIMQKPLSIKAYVIMDILVIVVLRLIRQINQVVPGVQMVFSKFIYDVV